MTTFLISLAALILGYLIYGRLVDNMFKPTDLPTPAMVHNDGVDYVPLPTWRVFMIQLLNIAGLGPIFGALAGAMWGPVVYLWIVLGSIFAGGVHDYLSGMISLREDGASIPDVVGESMGKTMLTFMRFFTILILFLIGVLFISGPAMLLAKLTGFGVTPWLLVVLVYYFLATFLPIDKIIGRFYPIFSICLLVMAAGLLVGLLTGAGGHVLPEMTLTNMFPAPAGKQLPIWPLMCVTVACGAISGFHSTQSPLMARCLKNERLGRPVFYGAMISEGIIALIWAAAGVSFYDGTAGLAAALKAGGPGAVVYDVCVGLMGNGLGATLAMLGVVACPITSGDTAFRSARLIIADWFKIPQTDNVKRLKLALPLIIVGAALTQVQFAVLWNYTSWSNQVLAAMVLWAGATYMYRKCENRHAYLIPMVPATFMSIVSSTYILQAKEGLQLPTYITWPAGLVIGLLALAMFLKHTVFGPKEEMATENK